MLLNMEEAEDKDLADALQVAGISHLTPAQ